MAQLEAAQQAALHLVRPLGVPVNGGINITENRAEIYVAERARLDAALQRAGRQLPDGAAAITVPELARPAANIFGGLAVNGCTTGFSVAGPQGLGFATAGHCPDRQYPLPAGSGADFPFIYEWRQFGPYDLQWHTTPGWTVRSWAYDGVPSYRYVTGTKARGDQWDGEWVCKYGAATHYTCGQIADRFYTSYYPYNDPSYVRVSNAGERICFEGDSGGPWYNGGTAYGITNGCAGNDGIYMAINYVQYTGLTVLVNCPWWGC